MARLYAQLFTLVFFVAGVGGLFVAGLNGGSGDVGNLSVHLTWFRVLVYLGLFATFVYVGFVADRHTGRIIVTAAGVLLVVLGIAGFIVGDRSGGAAGLHFPVSTSVFDLSCGVLAILSGLGTVEDDAVA